MSIQNNRKNGSRFKVYTFDEQLKKQEEYFKHFCEWVSSRSNVLAITVADEIDEKRGIDLWAVMKKSDPVPIQVKVDFVLHTTGNMAVETISMATYDGEWKPGWLSHLHSTRILAYCCGKTGQFRTYLSQAFFQRIMREYQSYKGFMCINGSRNGDQFWYAMGLLVPVNSMAPLVQNNANLLNLTSGKHELRIGGE